MKPAQYFLVCIRYDVRDSKCQSDRRQRIFSIRVSLFKSFENNQILMSINEKGFREARLLRNRWSVAALIIQN